MPSLWEIESKIMDCVDMETGEVIDLDALESLEMERDKKITNIGLWYKDLLADAAKYEEQEKNFKRKKEVAKNKAESLKNYLDRFLNGASWDNDEQKRFKVGYRTSKTVEVDTSLFMKFRNKAKFLRFKDPEPDKGLIKEALEQGKKIPGCEIVEHSNIQIK